MYRRIMLLDLIRQCIRSLEDESVGDALFVSEVFPSKITYRHGRSHTLRE